MRKNYYWYNFFRLYFVRIWVHLFLGKITILNKENMPIGKPMVIVMNHQNSFLDAFIIVSKFSLFAHFMTNAMVFKNPVVGGFLRSLNLIPIYRVRDGFRAVEKNKEIFELTSGYLKRGDQIFIFPEANHDLKRRLRPLSKGFSRMIFGTMEKYDWDLDLQVVPITVNYGDHRNSMQPVKVIIRDPIPVKKYEAVYKENEREAPKVIKEDVHDALIEHLVHVPNADDYPAYYIILDELAEDDAEITDPYLTNKRIAWLEEKLTKDDLEAGRETLKILERQNIRLKFAEQKNSWLQWIGFILGLPVLLNNLIPYQPLRHLTQNMIKDHAFDASIKVLVGGALLPLFYLLVFVLIGLISGSWLAALIYLGLSFLTAPLFMPLKRIWMRKSNRDKLKKLEKDKPALFQKIQNNRNRFIEIRQEMLQSE
jgi:1-acyl-sn-glycerol-3-phosphate acyltransferase